MSFLVKLDSTTATLLNETSDNFTVDFNPPINLVGSWEMGLIKANLWYSWYNISAEKNNNLMRYYNGSIYQNIVIPDGQYTITQLSNQIQSIMKTNGDFTVSGSGVDLFDIILEPNFSTLRVKVTVTSGYTLDLSLTNRRCPATFPCGNMMGCGVSSLGCGTYGWSAKPIGSQSQTGPITQSARGADRAFLRRGFGTNTMKTGKFLGIGGGSPSVCSSLPPNYLFLKCNIDICKRIY